MNRPVHFEFQADDVERAKKFYENVLGWKITQAMKKEETGMDYWLVMTGEKDKPGINGGMYRRDSAEEKYYLYDCTIEVPDIDEAMEKVKANGGMIVREKDMIPGVGWFASAKDTEGNRFGMLQATDERMQQ